MCGRDVSVNLWPLYRFFMAGQITNHLHGWAKPSRRYLLVQTGRVARLCGRLSDRTPADLAFLSANAPVRYRYVRLTRPKAVGAWPSRLGHVKQIIKEGRRSPVNPSHIPSRSLPPKSCLFWPPEPGPGKMATRRPKTQGRAVSGPRKGILRGIYQNISW
jgi:hypothetical protein